MTEPVPGRSRFKQILLTLAAVIAMGVAAGIGLYWWLRPREVPLARGWAARVSVLAGDGVPESKDGHVGNARFAEPFGVAVAPDGTIYVADAGESPTVRRIATDGSITTLAGDVRGYSDGLGSAASFNTPSALAIDVTGNLILADTGNNAIRRITPLGEVTTMAGDRFAGFQDGRALEARFNGPIGVAVDATGRVIVADTYNDRIRAILPDGGVLTIAGDGQPGWYDGPAEQARFDTPCGVAVDRAGNIYVADTGNGSVRVISIAGLVSTLTSTPPDRLFRPIGIAVANDGLLYVTDDRGRIVEIDPATTARIVAGSTSGFADGDGAAARFRGPAGVAVVAPGRLIVADSRNALMRIVAAPSRMGPRLPGPPVVAPRFDEDTFASQPLLWPLLPMEGPFEVTGTLGELRGGDGSERFHSGLDVQAFEGTPVVAVRPGVVSAPIATSDFGTLNESVRVGSVAYIHLRVGRQRNGDVFDPRFLPTYDETGRLIRIRVRRGTRFHAGEEVGTINAFNHVHLNVGWPGEELNPLDFRVMRFTDTVRPTIARNGIQIMRPDGQRFTQRKKGRLVIDGPVSIVVDAWDQADGNKPTRRLGVYRLGYQILNRNGTPAPGFESLRETIRFNRLIAGSDAPRLVYASGSGIPFYGGRRTRFLYVVTNTLRDGVAGEGKWDTTTLPPGDYIVRVLAADFEGNEAVANRDLAVTVAAPVAQ
jgi:DNA-binding beta-propeller fold protein YncE